MPAAFKSARPDAPSRWFRVLDRAAAWHLSHTAWRSRYPPCCRPRPRCPYMHASAHAGVLVHMYIRRRRARGCCLAYAVRCNARCMCLHIYAPAIRAGRRRGIPVARCCEPAVPRPGAGSRGPPRPAEAPVSFFVVRVHVGLNYPGYGSPACVIQIPGREWMLPLAVCRWAMP